MNDTQKGDFCSALCIVFKNFVLKDPSRNNADRTAKGGATLEAKNRRQDKYKAQKDVVLKFVTSAEAKGKASLSWDSIVLNLLDHVRIEAYASADNLFAPRFMAQTKLLNTLPEDEAKLIYFIRTRSAMALFDISGTYDSSGDTYKSILNNFNEIQMKVNAKDINTCFPAAAVLDWMSMYGYRKRAGSKDVRNTFIAQTFNELQIMADKMKVRFTDKDTRRDCLVKLRDALTEKKKSMVKAVIKVSPTDYINDIKIGDVKKEAIEWSYITDIKDTRPEKKKEENVKETVGAHKGPSSEETKRINSDMKGIMKDLVKLYQIRKSIDDQAKPVDTYRMFMFPDPSITPFSAAPTVEELNAPDGLTRALATFYKKRTANWAKVLGQTLVDAGYVKGPSFRVQGLKPKWGSPPVWYNDKPSKYIEDYKETAKALLGARDDGVIGKTGTGLFPQDFQDKVIKGIETLNLESMDVVPEDRDELNSIIDNLKQSSQWETVTEEINNETTS